ncbi:MAG: hypothetical protein ACE141_11870 [Bryobacteraceae bacterium]
MRGTVLTAVAAILACPSLQGAERRPAEGTASNDEVAITARAYLEKDAIQRLLGSELEESIAVVEVRLVPKAGTKLAVLRDDFELRSYKNGQRSTPFAPSQIAGPSVLTISSRGGGGGMSSQGNGPVWGPPMGGRPKRLGGEGGGVGNTDSTSRAVAETGKASSGNPLLDTLEEKVLPEGEISEPTGGLLYFFLGSRHKPKDVELFYRGPAGKLSLRFKD